MYRMLSFCHKLNRVLYFNNRNHSNFIKNCVNHSKRIAILDENDAITYKQILTAAYNLSVECQRTLDKRQKINSNIAVACENNFTFVVATFAAWISGSAIVPLHILQSKTQLNYFIDNSDSELILTSSDNNNLSEISKECNIDIINVSDFLNFEDVVSVDVRPMQKSRNSIILYTSGTTGKPKGVVHTFRSLDHLIEAQVVSWRWRATDRSLHCLPLNHMHGLVNALLTPLSVGASCYMAPVFNPGEMWRYLIERQITVFTGVPTMYSKLIDCYRQRRPINDNRNKSAAFIRATIRNNIRLMMCGSAPLTNRLRSLWKEITGVDLLERYGSSEAGIVLSQDYDKRSRGNVGLPMPGVQCAVARRNVYSENGYDILASADHVRAPLGSDNSEGELLIKSAGMFKEYYGLEKLTKEQFTNDGWFKSGDTVRIADGNIQILGRTSVDIIKSGGYKISALEIERVVLECPLVKACCVIGVPDTTWGQKVAIIIVRGEHFESASLDKHFKENLSSYEIPSIVKYIDSIKTNSMGKINKKELLAMYFEKELKQYV